MKRFSKYFILGLLFMSVAAFFTQSVKAQAFLDDLNRQTDSFAGEQGVNAGRAADPRLIVARVIQYGLSTMGMIFLGYIVFAGYLFLTAAGNDDQVTKAKKIMQNSILGIIITLSAYSITAFITRWEQQRLSPGRNEFIQTEDDFNSCNTNFADPASCP